MARLILMFNKQVIKEYPLLKDSITVGRAEDNTVVIDNLAVSSYHARIDKADISCQRHGQGPYPESLGAQEIKDEGNYEEGIEDCNGVAHGIEYRAASDNP